MLPATSPEPQKIAKPESVIITRPRRPIFGIPDGLGRSSRRGLLSSLILSLMLGFQYARKENRRFVGIPLQSRSRNFSSACDTCCVLSCFATSLSSSNSLFFRDFLSALLIQSAVIRSMGLGRTRTGADNLPETAAEM